MTEPPSWVWWKQRAEQQRQCEAGQHDSFLLVCSDSLSSSLQLTGEQQAAWQDTHSPGAGGFHNWPPCQLLLVQTVSSLELLPVDFLISRRGSALHGKDAVETVLWCWNWLVFRIYTISSAAVNKYKNFQRVSLHFHNLTNIIITEQVLITHFCGLTWFHWGISKLGIDPLSAPIFSILAHGNIGHFSNLTANNRGNNYLFI